MTVTLVSVTQNGQVIDFDANKIHVTVKQPIVCIKKLSNDEIANMLQIRKTASQPKLKKDHPNSPVNRPKRKLIPNEAAIRKAASQLDLKEDNPNPPAKRLKKNTIAIIEYRLNEIVWCKLKGHPHWPGKIVGCEKQKFEILWFNDYRKSKVFRSQLFKFNDQNFGEFSRNSKIGLEKAIKEAIIYGKTFHCKH